MRIEVPAFERHDRPAEEQRLERRELTRPVHQRGRRKVDRDQAGLVHLQGTRTGAGRAVGHVDAEEGVRQRRERGEEILVAPNHGLRHSGGAAGVQEDEIVTRALDPLHRLVCRDEVLVAERAVDERRAVVDLHGGPHLQLGVPHSVHPFPERTVKHDHLGVGVLEEVRELVRGVAVVHVGGDGPQLEGGEQRLEVLVRVIEIERDLRVGPQAERTEGPRQPRRPLVELPPGAPPLALDERRVVRDRVGHGLEHRPEVPVHGPSLTSSGAAYAATMAALPTAVAGAGACDRDPKGQSRSLRRRTIK